LFLLCKTKKNFYDFGTDLVFTIVYVPSEANSEIAIYLEEEHILLSAEVIQDHSFPNLYPKIQSTTATAATTITTKIIHF
jgi:hypothetical protein